MGTNEYGPVPGIRPDMPLCRGKTVKRSKFGGFNRRCCALATIASLARERDLEAE